MKRLLLFSSVFAFLAFGAQAQTRYLDEVFTDNQIIVDSDVIYGVNFSAYVPQALGGPQVIPLYLDVYMPDTAMDTELDRPVVVYLHTGSFLPKGLVSPMGNKTDSAAVEICRRFARLGYVAVSATYRLGWQPDNTSNLDLRRGSNLLAVYNALQDAKNAVRFIRASKLGAGDPYRTDMENIFLMGQGSGGYITFAYATLDKLSEVTSLSKFQYEGTVGVFGDTVNPGDPYVDTAVVGDWDGFGGKATITGMTSPQGLPIIDFSQPGRNIENLVGIPDDVKAVVNLGGALGDESWLEAGDPPMLSIHNVYDYYAPYYYGMVRVPVNGQFWDVVNVIGSYRAIRLANENFNNYLFGQANYTDPVWLKSKSHPNNHNKVDGIYPLSIPPVNPALPFNVNSNPWDFWDPADPKGANETNPNIKSQSLAYIDTVMAFVVPRLYTVQNTNNIGIVEKERVTFTVKSFSDQDAFEVEAQEIIETLTVTNLKGQEILRVTPSGSKVRIETSDWARGIYLITIQSGTSVSTEKISVYY